ncbi:hypothetical protein GCM10009688_28350 [Arthrobacter gandavensis]|uniref:Membrane protein involved in the export of O-antigen and teichoic acid n=1 Tax=Arthrobacter gandavensis TaxID=169960 RepID=A0ABP5AW63_9MICC|nr:hypothetical protein [Arthrobacter citreus]
MTALALRGVRRGLAGPGKRVGWGLADQGLSSLTNFLVGIVIAKNVGLEDFGAYALTFSAYCLVLGVGRAVASEPFAVRYSAVKSEQSQAAAAAAAGTALLLGAAGSVFALAACALLPEEYRGLAAALAIILPGVILQDAWRLLFFARGEGRAAFANDLVWAVLLVPAFAVDFLDGDVSAASLFLAWGCAGAVAAVFGAIQFGALPSAAASRDWLKDNKALWPRYVCEGLAINGSQQIYMFVLAGITGLASVGALRLVLVVLGPVNVLVQGIGAVAVPEAARALTVGRAKLRRTAAVFSVLVATGAAAWGLVVFILPEQWIAAVAGPGWSAATALALPLVLVQVLNGARTGPIAALRAMGEARRSMWTRIAVSLLNILLAVGGALAAGITGAAWGLALAAFLNLCLWLLQYKLAGASTGESARMVSNNRTSPAHRARESSTSTRGRGNNE